MRTNQLIFIAIVFPILLNATNLKIEAVDWYHEPNPENKAVVKMTVHWENAWHNERNHDAAWVAIKFQNKDWGDRPAKLAESGHRLLSNQIKNSPAPTIKIAEDGLGFFIFPENNYRGDVNWTIEIALDTAIFKDRRFQTWNHRIKVYGVEMVYIPEGGFTLGDPDTLLLNEGALYKSGMNGAFNGLFKIENEKSEIKIGKEKGQLYYRVKKSIYQGDQTGIILPDFPKGVHAYYIMKYELRQGQYVDFLNSLSDEQSQHRANFGGKNYYKLRGTIYFQNDEYRAAAPDRPCNFLSWDDAMAFADWMALRPMTELEFTKACRGPQQPVEHEFPWGNSSKDQIARYVDSDGNVVFSNGVNEVQLNDETRGVFGASYYWVMDLPGSLWERVITIGDPIGRSFKGSHGDGQITSFGFADVSDWPSGITETGGYGFRGGGFYENGKASTGLNPHAPIAHRRYGAWSGGNRKEAYGSRFVRTAD